MWRLFYRFDERGRGRTTNFFSVLSGFVLLVDGSLRIASLGCYKSSLNLRFLEWGIKNAYKARKEG